MTFASNPADEGYPMQAHLRRDHSPGRPFPIIVPEQAMKSSFWKRNLDRLVLAALYTASAGCALAGIYHFLLVAK